jgi:hypothetical protein
MNSHSVWLITYPQRRDSPAQRPTIALRQLAEEELMLWFASCMLGYLALAPAILHDPALPPGPTFLPADPIQRPLTHRYAHALMNTEFDCSRAFGCSCSAIERRMSSPPPDHEQPTVTQPTQRVTPIIESLAPRPKPARPKLQSERRGDPPTQ